MSGGKKTDKLSRGNINKNDSAENKGVAAAIKKRKRNKSTLETHGVTPELLSMVKSGMLTLVQARKIYQESINGENVSPSTAKKKKVLPQLIKIIVLVLPRHQQINKQTGFQQRKKREEKNKTKGKRGVLKTMVKLIMNLLQMMLARFPVK